MSESKPSKCEECGVKGMCKLLLRKKYRFPTSNCKIIIENAIKDFGENAG